MVRRDPTIQPAPPPDDLAAAIMQIMSGQGAAVDPNDPLVYLGSEARPRSTVQQRRIPGQQASDIGYIKKGAPTATLSVAKAMFYGWTPAKRAQWGAYLAEIGYIDAEDAGDYRVQLEAWFEVVEQGAGFTAAGKEFSPRQVARWIAGTKPPPEEEKVEGPFTGTRSHTSTSVDLTDPETAKALVNKALASLIGREANADELRAMGAVLARAERANPTTTTSSATYDEGIQTSTSSTTSGGLSARGAEQVLDDEARQKPEYGAYQAASTYMNALLSAIQSPV